MVKISDIELPVIFKNQLLFKAGNWNHHSFSNDTVKRSVDNTKWSKLNRRLYLKHDNMYDISQWKGNVDNISTLDNKGIVEVRGDVAVWDANEALQILYGDKPIAMSADIEYNEDGVMFFTGFALEADPGVRDHEMFLSDAVKNELNGFYKASFSNLVDPNQNQSAERRLDKENQTMENTEIQPKQETVQTAPETVLNSEKPVSEVTESLLKGLEALRGEVRELKTVTEQPKVVPAATQPEPPPQVQNTEITNSDNKGTVVDNKQINPEPKVETPMVDMKTVEMVAEKIAEKFRQQEPSAMTVAEMNDVDNRPLDEKTVDNIVDFFDKKRNGQNNI